MALGPSLLLRLQSLFVSASARGLSFTLSLPVLLCFFMSSNVHVFRGVRVPINMLVRFCALGGGQLVGALGAVTLYLRSLSLVILTAYLLLLALCLLSFLCALVFVITVLTASVLIQIVRLQEVLAQTFFSLRGREHSFELANGLPHFWLV